MKIEEKFAFVLEYAIKNGFDLMGLLPNNKIDWKKAVHQWQGCVDLEFYYMGKTRRIAFETIIFDHGFVRALCNRDSKTNFWSDEEFYQINNFLHELVMKSDIESRLNYLMWKITAEEKYLPKI